MHDETESTTSMSMLRTAQGALCNLLEMFNGASPYVFISAYELFDVMFTDQVVALVQVACGVKPHKIPNFIMIDDSSGQNVIRFQPKQDNYLPVFLVCEVCCEHVLEYLLRTRPNISLFHPNTQYDLDIGT
jgi:hypothetical protein